MAKKGRKEKLGPDQKIIKKLAKKWEMPCECSDSLLDHINGKCKNCICPVYTPNMSVDLVQERVEV
ncbi:MAG TPA: hypothetical protein VKR58_14730 [Aquella sp.]|nr:hypothetical protein [Aquella sp.]